MNRSATMLSLAASLIFAATLFPATRMAIADDKAASAVEREVRVAFDGWVTALTHADKKAYLAAFWHSPRLVIRVASGEWRGFDAYRKRIESAQLPPGSVADYRNVQVVALGSDAAVVTYERPAPAAMGGGDALVFVGTLVLTRTSDGWRIAAWHAHSIGGMGGPAPRPH